MPDFINFFRKASKHLDKDADQTPPTPKKDPETTEELVNHYRAEYSDIDIDTLRNLNELKDITKEPKTETPDKPLEEIKKRLGESETAETLRQERWALGIKCPYCESEKIRKLSADEQTTKHIYKYKCLDCKENFDDESATDMEGGVPPLRTWMLCWYLYGCTNSLQYIAVKLGLDVGMVEAMVQYMQKLFNAEQPLTNFLTFDEWSQKFGTNYKAKMQDSIIKRQVLLGQDTPNAPGDTAEYRRQKEKHRGPKPRY